MLVEPSNKYQVKIEIKDFLTDVLDCEEYNPTLPIGGGGDGAGGDITPEEAIEEVEDDDSLTEEEKKMIIDILKEFIVEPTPEPTPSPSPSPSSSPSYYYYTYYVLLDNFPHSLIYSVF